MGLLLCTKKTENPYKLPETDIKIFCIEELCYYIYNNTYMITADFFTKELIDFVDEELNLKSLAQKLKHGIDYNEKFSDMVMYIMNASNYYNQEEKGAFVKDLELISSKSKSGRIKARADMLLANKKYVSAIAAYSIILDKKEIADEEDYYSNILNNMAIAYANMFEYKKAAQIFEKAYNYMKKEDYLDNLICATILCDEKEYTQDILKKYEIDSATMDKYKKVIDYQTGQIAKSKEYKSLVDKVIKNPKESIEEYREKVNETLKDLRDEYRKQFS